MVRVDRRRAHLSTLSQSEVGLQIYRYRIIMLFFSKSNYSLRVTILIINTIMHTEEENGSVNSSSLSCVKDIAENLIQMLEHCLHQKSHSHKNTMLI